MYCFNTLKIANFFTNQNLQSYILLFSSFFNSLRKIIKWGRGLVENPSI